MRYRIRITNTGNATARRITVTDRMPPTTSLVRRSRGLRLVRGNAVYKIARLAPRRTRTITLRLRFDADARGRRCNHAFVRASNARGDRARTCAQVRRLVRRVTPAGTG